MWRDLEAKSAIASMVMPFATLGWPYSAIDALGLLDKVLLHEMTHTSAGRQTIDVSNIREQPARHLSCLLGAAGDRGI